VLVGASVRAAAFSAMRAGLEPWCADLFADADLQARCPVLAVPASRYPHGLVDALAAWPPGPWMYTGALENRPHLVDRLSRKRALWGNGAAVLRKVRSPYRLAACLRSARLAHLAVQRCSAPLSREGQWLCKPWRGAGGRGIRFHVPGRSVNPKGRCYLQEYIEGESCAAIYVGNGQENRQIGRAHV